MSTVTTITVTTTVTVTVTTTAPAACPTCPAHFTTRTCPTCHTDHAVDSQGYFITHRVGIGEACSEQPATVDVPVVTWTAPLSTPLPSHTYRFPRPVARRVVRGAARRATR